MNTETNHENKWGHLFQDTVTFRLFGWSLCWKIRLFALSTFYWDFTIILILLIGIGVRAYRIQHLYLLIFFRSKAHHDLGGELVSLSWTLHSFWKSHVILHFIQLLLNLMSLFIKAFDICQRLPYLAGLVVNWNWLVQGVNRRTFFVLLITLRIEKNSIKSQNQCVAK